MDKAALRKHCLKVRSEKGAAAIQRISLTVVEKLLDLKEIRDAACVMAYLPLVSKGELDLKPLLDSLSEQKLCAVPVMQGTKLIPVQYSRDMVLVQAAWNVPEPELRIPLSVPPDVIICPGLAADITGSRLGYGKGFYDAFLAGRDAVTVFPVLDQLVFEMIPVENHDRRMDIVVTEDRLLRSAPRF